MTRVAACDEHVAVDHRVAVVRAESPLIDERRAVDRAPDLGVAVDRDQRAVDGLPELHGHVTDPDAAVLVVVPAGSDPGAGWAA